MQPRQLALLDLALDLVGAECLRSPVATWSAGHLKAIIAEQLLRAGTVLLERGTDPGEEKLVRMQGEVLRTERCVLDARHRLRPARGRRLADLRVWEPVPFALDLFARSSATAPERLGSRAVRERLASMADGTTDALLIACDRRIYDAMRVERPLGEDHPEAARLCALLLPPSATLGAERSAAARRLGGRVFNAAATVTPMVFGAQRVIAAIWPAQRAVADAAVAPQLDAFEADAAAR